jgi:hypothetical protein
MTGAGAVALVDLWPCLLVDKEAAHGMATGSQGRGCQLMQDRKPGAIQEPHCPICSETGYWGRADVQPFLDRAG